MSKIADEFVKRVLGKLGKQKPLSEEGMEALEAAARDRVQLTVDALSGEDVTAELAIVDATIANWVWVGAYHARFALAAAAEELAAVFGKLLGVTVRGIL